MNIRVLKILILIALFSTFYSCGEKVINKEAIIGKWKVSDYKTDMNKGNDISPAVLQGAKEIALSSAYEFKGDGTYKFSSNFENFEGTWTFNDNNLEMKFTSEYEKNGIEKFEVIELNNSKMKWEKEYVSGKESTILSKN